MKTSGLYAKIVLTVIAFCLLVIIVRDISFVKEAKAVAEHPALPYGETIDVNIRSVDWKVKLPVEVTNSYLNVKFY